jgi:hypothetical protein
MLSVIGLLVRVQCWAMCRVMFKEFNNVYIGVPVQWKTIFGTRSTSRISTLWKAMKMTYRKIMLRATEMT